MEKEKDQLYKMRHSLAHIMATAVLDIDPKAKLAIGPVIDNGFYYDFEFSPDITLDDKALKDIEKRMKKLISSGIEFKSKTVSADEALKLLDGQPYKQELVREFAAAGEDITFYESGRFTDLCEGPHVANTKEINVDGFKVDRVAGAYWRGDEKNKMLTRIYGLAFATKEELDTYLHMIEEAKKRDHKKLGKELDLFVFSELVGSGLPLWTPKGTLLRNLLDGYVWELRSAHGYERVEIPHITKKDLYETSGHWDKYKDDLMHVSTREGYEFAMKPMNCPHHTQIYARKGWSYRDLPQRYANTTMCYRDEQSGELSGLSRVRAFTQDDAHVFCRMSQMKDEFSKIWDIIHTFYGTFGFELKVRISKHDPAHPEKYLGDKESWVFTENALAEIVKEKGATSFDGIGEAAFYGPKLDFMTKDALGREWQVATIQLDTSMPERFDLSCKNEKGEQERIVMIHAAIMGSIERFLSVLIEHIAGNFPLWLAPVQVKILPITDAHKEYARTVYDALKKVGMRVELDEDAETLGKKIRNCKLMKLPYFLVIGDKEVEEKTITIESNLRGNEGALSLEKLIEKFQEEIKNKKA